MPRDKCPFIYFLLPCGSRRRMRHAVTVFEQESSDLQGGDELQKYVKNM
jgi:hypothetical protein